MDLIKQTILETLSEEGMSELLGGTDPSTDFFEHINNGINCNEINNGINCDVINNGINCSKINNKTNCYVINNKTNCKK